MPSIIDTLTKSIFQKATVTYKEQIAPKVYHIRIQGDGLRPHHYIPGEHIRLFVGTDRDTALDSKLRTYSIWDHSSSRGTVDMAICIHSTGIGARWAGEARVGEAIHYMGPKGKLTIDYAADSCLMIGDPSALSHMYAIRKGMPKGKKAIGITYGAHPTDCYPDLDGTIPFQFLQLGYDPTEALIREAEALRDRLSDTPVIYLGGDARVCKSLSRHFRHHWPAATVMSKGFWMPGKTGMD
jgi:NADPH-dependent ferric siderophore reductase